eukprot:sb/3470886/
MYTGVGLIKALNGYQQSYHVKYLTASNWGCGVFFFFLEAVSTWVEMKDWNHRVAFPWDVCTCQRRRGSTSRTIGIWRKGSGQNENQIKSYERMNVVKIVKISFSRLSRNALCADIPLWNQGRVHLSEETRVHLKDHWDLEEGFGAKREPDLSLSLPLSFSLFLSLSLSLSLFLSLSLYLSLFLSLYLSLFLTHDS